MQKNYYVLSNGRLERKENTINLDTGEKKKRIPVKNVGALQILGQVDFNTRFLSFLNQENTPAHFYNWFDRYVGSYYPQEFLNSGKLLVKQVLCYHGKEKRIKLAREIIRGASHNMIKNLEYYKRKKRKVENIKKEIEKLRDEIPKIRRINNLLGLEGKIRERYYKSFSKILRSGFELKERTKRPPENEVNAMISFGNSLLYSTTLTEIYKTQLNPTISFLHEPRERRFSLSLDISEIFKPLLVDKSIFKLINKQIIQPEDFDKDLKGCLLSEKGKEEFIREFESRLEKTVKHESLNRKVSQQRLLRLEAYKLAKHCLEDKNYESYKA